MSGPLGGDFFDSHCMFSALCAITRPSVCPSVCQTGVL